jgi:uncharacterized damage-inducible protein DinB
MPASEPSRSISDPTELLLGQLDYYRSTLQAKLDGLGEDDLRGSILPSGWSPLELLNHLVHVERRWMQWGFEGEQVPEPWGDHEVGTDRWVLLPGDSLETLTARLRDQASRTESVARSAELTQRAAVGGRFPSDPPTLGWILLHVLQEYARHVGQLDVVRELIDGRTGE